MKVQLKRGEEARLEERPAIRTESYLAYLKGRHLLSHWLREETVEAADRWDAIRPGGSLGLRVVAYAGIGETEKARDLLREQEKVKESVTWGDAWLRARIGDVEGCLRLLNKAMDHRVVWFTPFRMDPTLEPVRKDPRFREILRRAGLG